MDLIKIGDFISSKRKEMGITQSKLAEKLYVSNRAVSKWENGVCLPDIGTMPELCELLNITINDLFSGEIVDMKDNEKKFEENLLEMAKLKEERDKQLLDLEIIFGLIITALFVTIFTLVSYIDINNYLRATIMIFSLVIFIIALLFLLGIEQKAGYYECRKCHHRYVPTYKSVLFAMHSGRIRRMKCPECGEKSWQKKVLKK